VSSVRALQLFLRKTARLGRLPDYVIVEGPLAGGHLGFGMDWAKYDLATIVTEILAWMKTEQLDIPVLPAGGIFTGSWSDIWMGMKLVAFGVVDAIIGVVLELAGAIAGVVDALTGLFGGGTHWQQGIRDFRDSLRADMAEGMGVQDLSFTRPTRPGAATPGVPASDAMSSMPAVAAMTPAIPASFPMTPAAPLASPPVTINLQVDGTTLATAVHRADRDSATRSFSPVPAY